MTVSSATDLGSDTGNSTAGEKTLCDLEAASRTLRIVREVFRGLRGEEITVAMMRTIPLTEWARVDGCGIKTLTEIAFFRDGHKSWKEYGEFARFEAEEAKRIAYRDRKCARTPAVTDQTEPGCSTPMKQEDQ